MFSDGARQQQWLIGHGDDDYEHWVSRKKKYLIEAKKEYVVLLEEVIKN